MNFNLDPTPLTTPIPGPAGTICVNPAIFNDVGLISDFKLLGCEIAIIMFILGMAAMYIRFHWEDYFGSP